MNEDNKINLKLTVKSQRMELSIEISGSKDDVEYFLNNVLNKFWSGDDSVVVSEAQQNIQIDSSQHDELPTLNINAKESLSSILKKLFYSGWGSKPRALKEVLETMEILGLYYPKSSIAVTLQRLVKKGELRRIKGDDGTYRYVTASPRGGLIE